MPSKFNQKHLTTLIIAICLGLVFSLRNIIVNQKALSNPQLVFVSFGVGDEATYASQIREVYEGKLLSGDAYTYEARSMLPIFPWLTTLILGLFAKLLNSVQLVFTLADFLFPAIIFILIVKFVYRLTHQYWGAIVTGLSSLCLYHLTTKIPPVTHEMASNLFSTLTLQEPFFLTFNRLPPPQFTFIFFFLFITSLYQTLISKTKSAPLITGIFSGLLAYIYFYHWTASLVILSLSIGFSLIKKSKPVLKRLITALSTALIISSGYLFQILSPGLIDKQLSEGRVDGRFIEPLTSLRYGIFSIILYYFLPPGPIKQLLISIFLSAITLMNLQVITGFTMDAGHWPNSTFEPMVVIAGFILVLHLLKKHKLTNILKYIWILIIPIFLYASLNQIIIAEKHHQLHLISKGEKQLYDWLNQNSPPDSVVLSLNKRINRLLPAMTHSYVYLPYGSYTQINVDQLWQRFNLGVSILQLTPDAITDILSNSQDLAGYLFVQTYRYTYKSNLTNLSFSPEALSRISKAHPIFSPGAFYIPDNIKQLNLDKINKLNQLPISNRICKYKLDYLVLNPIEKKLMTSPLNKNLFKTVFEQDEITLYQLNHHLCQPSR